MKSLMGRLLVLLTVVALLLALSGPAAMANHLDGNDLDVNDFGINDRDDLEDFFGHNLRNNDFGILSDFDDDCDDEDIVVRDVGDEECVFERGDADPEFCARKHGAIEWLNNFFAQNDAEQNAAE